MSSAFDSDPVSVLLQQYPEDANADYTSPLTEDELLNIGLQSAQLVADSNDALATMKLLSQDFPRYASSVARRVVVSSELEEEVVQNQAKAQGGVSVAWLNGAAVGEGEMNPFSYGYSFLLPVSLILTRTETGYYDYSEKNARSCDISSRSGSMPHKLSSC